MEQSNTEIKETANKLEEHVGNNAIRHLYIDYEMVLNSYRLSFERNGPYLIVNGDQPHCTWILFVSVIRPQISDLFKKLLPFLKREGLDFALPENSNTHGVILDGGLGYQNIGKVFEIYPASEEEANIVAQQLIDLTAGFAGPVIPTAYHLGNCVYAEEPGLDYPGQSPNLTSAKKSNWPFRNIKRVQTPQKIKWLNKKYFLTHLLKSDAKGNVYKGFNLRNWTNINWCIIKQGKNHQCHDDAGRDIKDRLKWQFEAQLDLCNIIPVPKPIEYLEKNGDAYFIMQFIEGQSYNDYISAIQRGRKWEDLEVTDQITLIQLLIQAACLVDQLHSQGFIHRDLSPENFIVNHENKLYAIDIELCYNYHTNQPYPFFTLGTEGYMSPEQTRCFHPKIEDDIYGLGGLLIRTFTGISPTKFAPANGEKLSTDLGFFIKNKRLCWLCCTSWDSDYQQRPEIKSIRHNLELYYSLLLTNNHSDNTIKNELSDSLLKEKIERSLLALWLPIQFSNNKTWYSKTKNCAPQIANQLKSITWYPGLHTGITGIIYLLALSDQFGYDLGDFREQFYENFSLVKSYFEQNNHPDQAGLYHGAAGFAVLTASMINQGQLENTITNIDFIAKLLHRENQSINLADGICGQGLAIMKCRRLLDFPHFSERLNEIAVTVINEQNKDGSWDIKQTPFDKQGIKIYSLLHGIAGISYFLMLFGENHYSEQSKQASLKALGWLLKQRINSNGQFIWNLNIQNTAIDPWLEYGFSGIALVFIKAYELYHDPEYRDAATSALLAHPAKITSNYFSQANGLSGLGEVYLEAYQVFKEHDWLDRAKHIADFFLHTGRDSDHKGNYWLDGSDQKPSADLMTGNSGIIHFLLRCQHPLKIKFPILSL
jgi:serine/threonine protein kinase